MFPKNISTIEFSKFIEENTNRRVLGGCFEAVVCLRSWYEKPRPAPWSVVVSIGSPVCSSTLPE